MLNMQVGRDFERSIISRLTMLDLERVNRVFLELEEEARGILGEIGIPPQDMVFRRSIEMRYVGQFHEVEVADVPVARIGPEELNKITDAFHLRHKELFTFNIPAREVEVLNARLKATARQEVLELAEIPQESAETAKALKRRRPVLWTLSKGYEDTPVYDGGKLGAGHELAGPAIIEEQATTVVVPSSYVCTVDRVKNYVLSRR
jgi:N-methylhydantoinase A